MKIKQEFVLRQIADDHILIPLAGIENNFEGIITLNDTAATIWGKIVEGYEKDDIISFLQEEYDVSCEKATVDVEKFCEHLVDLGILE